MKTRPKKHKPAKKLQSKSHIRLRYLHAIVQNYQRVRATFNTLHAPPHRRTSCSHVN